MLFDASGGPSEGNANDLRLLHLAQILGCKPEDFISSADGPADIVAAAELLGLWLAIETPDDRERLLAAARQIAGS